MGRVTAGGRVGRPPAVPGELPEHLSVSQVETLSDCGMKYKLQRLDGIREVPAWWNIGGTAFHATIEWWERQYFATGTRPGTGQSLARFEDELYAEILNAEGSIGAEIRSAQWRAGGSGKENGAWWRENGALMVTKYVAAHQGDGPEISSSHGPAIELEFELDVDGIPVKGFIDQVRHSADPASSSGTAFHVVDLKAGRSAPGGTFQLGVYAHAFRRAIDTSAPILGRYWLARKGEYTQPVDLDRAWPWEAIAYRVHMAERIRRAGLYQPRESSFCGSCGVNDACPTRTGAWPKL